MNLSKYYFYAARPQQWIKNLFIFLPLIFSQCLSDMYLVSRSFFAFISFCSASSSMYFLNDLIDYERDRLHPLKKMRPLPSGKISRRLVVPIAFLLSCLSLFIAFSLQKTLGLILIVYLLFNILYSFILKKIVIIDVMSISIFFILRVLAGAAVIEVEVSHWLLICTGVLALFIGFNKRRHELYVLGRSSPKHRTVLVKYGRYFIDQMSAVLTASTVIMYTLYTVDSATVLRFGSRSLLFTVPFVYYGIFRYLYLIHKQRQGGDPSRILLSDRNMLVTLLLWGAAVVLVIYVK